MLEAIKNACIFLLIAQILMVLVPEEAYAKYVRVLVSLILILKITQPFLILISGREAQEALCGIISEGASFLHTERNREPVCTYDGICCRTDCTGAGSAEAGSAGAE